MVDRFSSAEDLLSLCSAENLQMQHLGMRFMPDIFFWRVGCHEKLTVLYATTTLEALTCCSRSGPWRQV